MQFSYDRSVIDIKCEAFLLVLESSSHILQQGREARRDFAIISSHLIDNESYIWTEEAYGTCTYLRYVNAVE